MKYLHLIVIGALVLTSCGSKDESSENTDASNNQKEEAADSTARNDSSLIAKDSLPDEQEEIELVYFSDAFTSTLKKYLSETEVILLQNWATRAQELKTDDDFMDWYSSGQKMIDQLNSAMYKNTEKYDAYDVVVDVDDYQHEMNGFYLSCVAECTELDFTFDNRVLDSLAQMTEGTQDDEFMALCDMSEGDFGNLTEYGFKKWFTQTWDYGGSTNIGDSSAYNFLIAHDHYVDQYGKSDLTELLGKVRRNALEMGYDFQSHMFSPSKISAELRMIIEDVRLSKGEQERIEDRIEQLKDPKANNLDVNCDTEDCPYG